MRRRKLPPDIDPNRVYGAPNRGRKQQCEHCLGWTRAVKGQTLEQAVANHQESCPGVHRINPKRRKE